MAVITRVQSAKGGATNATTTSFNITFGATPTPGNIIIACLSPKGSSIFFKVTATNITFFGNCDGFNATAGLSPMIYVGVVGSSPGSTIGFTNMQASSIAVRAVAAEYSGLNAVRFDNPINGTNGNSGSPATPTLTTQDAEELIIAILTHRGTWATEQTGLYTSPTNSFSIVDQTSTNINTSNNDVAIAMLERITAAAVSGITAGATISSAQWASDGQAFRIAPNATPSRRFTGY